MKVASSLFLQVGLLVLIPRLPGMSFAVAAHQQCEQPDQVARLILKVKDECEDVVAEEDNEYFHRLLRPDVFFKYCGDIVEAEEKDANRGTGTKYLCQFYVSAIINELKETNEEDFAEETIRGFQILDERGFDRYSRIIISFIKASPELKQLQADGFASAILAVGSSPEARSLVCSQIAAGDNSCSFVLGNALQKVGFNVKSAPFLIAAVTETTLGIWSAYSAYKDGKISAAEMETTILVTTTEAVIGGVGAYSGCQVGATLAGILFLPAAGVGCWFGSYLGYEAGVALSREFLDWYLDGRVLKLDKLRRCRDVLGGVSYYATPKEIKSAWRKISLHLHPDKKGVEGAQEKANFCVGMLLENADSDAQPFFGEFFRGMFQGMSPEDFE